MLEPCSTDTMKNERSIVLKACILLAIMYVVIYILPLGHRPLIMPDESRYAEIPREMIANDQWMLLRQAGLPYYEKSPLGYWLKAISISLFGRNNFAVRLPSALAAGLTALALFFVILRRRANAIHATIAAMVYLSCVLVFGVGTFAVLDSLFSLFVCFSMIFYLAAEDREGRQKVFWLALSGAACGAAFLTKGFTALVIPALTLFAWHMWEKTYRRLFLDWIIPILAAMLVVAPAAYVLHVYNPDFWRYFFWTEHIQRFLNPSDGQHKAPLWYFLPVFAIGTMPWFFFLPAIIRDVKQRAATDRMTRFCVCWLVVPFLFFSLCGGKLPTYILPCFAPFAILTADAGWFGRDRIHFNRFARAGAGILIAALVAFTCWLPLSKEEHLRKSVFEDKQSIAVGVSILITACILLLAAKTFKKGRGGLKALGLVALSFCSMFLAVTFFLPYGIENRKSPTRLMSAVEADIPPNAFFLADEQTLALVCWYFQRDDVIFFGRTGELEYGLEHANAINRFARSPHELGDIIKEKLRLGQPVVVFAGDHNFAVFENMVSTLVPDLRHASWPFIWALYLPENGKGFIQARGTDPAVVAGNSEN